MLDGFTFMIYHKLHASEWTPLSERANLVWMSAPSNGCLLWQHRSVWIALSTCHYSLIENKWQFNLLYTYTRLTRRVVSPGPVSFVYFVLCVTTVWSKSGTNCTFCRHSCQYSFIGLFLWHLWSLTIDCCCFEKSEKAMFHKVFDALSFVIFLWDFTDNAKKNFSLNNTFVSSHVVFVVVINTIKRVKLNAETFTFNQMSIRHQISLHDFVEICDSFQHQLPFRISLLHHLLKKSQTIIACSLLKICAGGSANKISETFWQCVGGACQPCKPRSLHCGEHNPSPVVKTLKTRCSQMWPPTACEGWAEEMDLCNDPAIVRALSCRACRTGVSLLASEGDGSP